MHRVHSGWLPGHSLCTEYATSLPSPPPSLPPHTGTHTSKETEVLVPLLIGLSDVQTKAGDPPSCLHALHCLGNERHSIKSLWSVKRTGGNS